MRYVVLIRYEALPLVYSTTPDPMSGTLSLPQGHMLGVSVIARIRMLIFSIGLANANGRLASRNQALPN